MEKQGHTFQRKWRSQHKTRSSHQGILVGPFRLPNARKEAREREKLRLSREIIENGCKKEIAM